MQHRHAAQLFAHVFSDHIEQFATLYELQDDIQRAASECAGWIPEGGVGLRVIFRRAHKYVLQPNNTGVIELYRSSPTIRASLVAPSKVTNSRRTYLSKDVDLSH